MTAHDKLRLRSPLYDRFLKRDCCEKENAWLRRLRAENEEEMTLIREKKLLVRKARDEALYP